MLHTPDHNVNFKQKCTLDTISHFCVWNLATSKYQYVYCTAESLTSICPFKMV